MTASDPGSGVLSALPAQIDRIVHSDLFKSSEALRRILIYLGEHAVQSPGRPAKEYEIATEVLGRPAEFDSRADSCVRVQVGRLRSRLRRYYAGPGVHDRLELTVPRGCYMLAMKWLEPVATMPARPRPVLVPPPPPRKTSWTSYSLVAAICLTIGALLGVVVTSFITTQDGSARWVLRDVSR